MANIGSLGIGSGLDLASLLDKISASEKGPLNAIRARQAAVNTRISAYGALQSLLSTVQAAATKLSDPVFLGAFKSTSSASDVLTASSDTTAVAGSYAVTVTQLAQGQSLASGGVAHSTDPIGAAAATLTIDFGSIAGTLNATSGTYEPGATFTVDAAKPAVSVQLEAGKTSLADVRDAINAASGAAVTASIINDGTSDHLVLASTLTGQNTSMRVSVGGTNAALQALLGNEPQGTQALRQTAAAQDAALTANGIAVSSASNTVKGALQGVTLTLTQEGSSTVTVERDTASVKNAIADFAGGYNKLAAKVRELTAYSSESGGAALAGDATARRVMARLSAPLMESRAGEAGDPTRISGIGVAFQKDGTLLVNDATLTAALGTNPSGVARLFAGSSSTDTSGLAKRFSAAVDTLTADAEGQDKDGLLTLAVAGAKQSITRLDKDYDAADARLQAKLQIYRAQFKQLDMVMSGMTATSNYLTQQFARQTTK